MEEEQSDVGNFEMEKPLRGMIPANLMTRSRLRERERASPQCGVFGWWSEEGWTTHSQDWD